MPKSHITPKENQRIMNLQFEMEQRQRRTAEALKKLHAVLAAQNELYKFWKQEDFDRIAKEYEEALKAYVSENDQFVKSRDAFERAVIASDAPQKDRQSVIGQGAQI